MENGINETERIALCLAAKDVKKQPTDNCPVTAHHKTTGPVTVYLLTTCPPMISVYPHNLITVWSNGVPTFITRE